MKYTGSVVINRPIDVVAKWYADPEHLGEYQDGFVRKELIKGEMGQEGAISKLYYKYGKRDMILEERVVKNRLPHSFEAFYHHKHMDNTFVARFTDLGNNKTRYETDVHYVRINWFMPKLMAILFPSMYRKAGEKWMKNFKTFVEKQEA